MKRLLLLIAMILSVNPRTLYGQTQTTITGTIQTPTGVAATSGYVEFRLRPSSSAIAYRVSGTAVLAPQASRCKINSSGAVVGPTGTGSCLLWGNTVIQPASTGYDVVFAPGNTVTSTINNELISGATYDLASPVFNSNVNLVPQYQTITTAPIAANLVPSANKQFNLGDSGHYYGEAYIDSLFMNNFLPKAITSGLVNNITTCVQAGADAGAKLQAAINAAPSGGVVDCNVFSSPQSAAATVIINKPLTVILPSQPFTFTPSVGIQVSANDVHLLGLGSTVTKLISAPNSGGGKILIEVLNSGSEIFGGSLEHISLYSSDSTHIKVGIDLYDISSYVVRDITIGGTVVHGGTQYWSDNTNGSIGIRTNGREALDIGPLNIAADTPLNLSTNTNSAITADHFHFHDLNLTANANPVIKVTDNAFLQHITFDGFQAWVKGTDGFKWTSAAGNGARPMLKFANVGREQVEDATHHVIDIEMSGGDSLQNLTVENFYGPTINQGHFIKLRGVSGITMTSLWYIGNGTALDLDSTSTGCVSINNSFTAVGGTFSTSGFPGCLFYDQTSGRLVFNSFDTTEFLTIPNAQFFSARNAANNASVKLLGLDASNVVQLAPSGSQTTNIGGSSAELDVALGTVLPTGCGVPGIICVQNNKSLAGVNAAGNAAIAMIKIDTNNNVAIDPGAAGAVVGGSLKFGSGLTAQGGGAAATLGTIGGSGPATNTQSQWQSIKGSNGQTYWFPVWQ